MVHTTRTPRLYQSNPPKRSRDKFFKENGWNTVDGYLYEADKATRCVEWAACHYFKTPFTYFVSLNFLDDLDPPELNKLLVKVCRYLKDKKVVALCVVEASKLRTTKKKGRICGDRFNVHLLLRSVTYNIKDLIKTATKGFRTNIKADKFNSKKGRNAAAYMFKAKRAKWRDGKLVTADRWAKKRTLFKKEHKIRKYRTIGSFWPAGMNKEKIWGEIMAVEAKIAQGMGQPGVDEYTDTLQALTGGWFTRKRVLREVAYWGVPAGPIGDGEGPPDDFPSEGPAPEPTPLDPDLIAWADNFGNPAESQTKMVMTPPNYGHGLLPATEELHRRAGRSDTSPEPVERLPRMAGGREAGEEGHGTDGGSPSWHPGGQLGGPDLQGGDQRPGEHRGRGRSYHPRSDRSVLEDQQRIGLRVRQPLVDVSRSRHRHGRPSQGIRHPD